MPVPASANNHCRPKSTAAAERGRLVIVMCLEVESAYAPLPLPFGPRDRGQPRGPIPKWRSAFVGLYFQCPHRGVRGEPSETSNLTTFNGLHGVNTVLE